jgi:tetratricopeptide (TPR) repeat protein
VAAPEGSAAPEVRDAVRGLVTVGLQQSQVVIPLPEGQLQRGLRLAGKADTTRLDPETAMELAVRGAVRTVVTLTVDRLGEGFVIALKVLDAETGNIVAVARSEAVGENSLLTAVDQGVRALSTELGGRRDQIGALRSLDEIMTPSFEAYRKYRLAKALGEIDLDLAEARRILREALALDPEFVSAWHALGLFYYNSNPRMLDSAVWAWERGLQHTDRLTEVQRYHLEALLHIRRDDFRAALNAYDRILNLNPADAVAHSNRALVLGGFRRWSDAVEGYERAAALSPFGQSRNLIVNRARSLLAVGQFDDARVVIDGLTTPRTLRRHLELQLALASTDWVRAESLAVAYLADPTSLSLVPGRSALALACVFAARGAIDAADRMLVGAEPSQRFGIALARSMLVVVTGRVVPLHDAAIADTGWTAWVWEAIRATYARESDRAANANQRLREYGGGGRGHQSHVGLVESILAAKAGRWSDALRLLDIERRKRTGPEIDLFVRWLSGEAHEAAGQLDSAAAYFEHAVQSDLEPYELFYFGIPYSFAHFRLGKLYTQLEQYDRAEEHYLTFLETFTEPDPEYEWMVTEARAALEELARGR